jgi:hypothetical protein
MADSKKNEWESAPTKSVMDGWESAPSSVSVPGKTPDEIKPTPEKEKLSPTRVGGAGLMGGALGAAMPELMTGAGLIPSPLSPYLISGGQILRGMRSASALGGALSGAGGETLKQLERRYGKPDETVLSFPGVKVTREDAAGLIGEFAAPGAVSATGKLIKGFPITRTVMGALEKYSGVGGAEMLRDAASRQLATVRGKENATETSYYRDIFDSLQKLDKTSQSQANTKIADAGIKADDVLKESRLRASQIIATDKIAAEKIIEDGQEQAKKLIKDAMDSVAAKTGIRRRAEAAGRKAVAAPEQTLQSIGNPQSQEAEIGGALQKRIVTNIGDEQTALNKAYKDDKVIVENIINQKQSSGILIKDTESGKKFLDFLDNKLLEGKYAKEAPFATVTEPGLKKVYRDIKNAIIDQRIRIGVDSDGNPVTRKVPTSYEAIDHIRRRLGQAFEGSSVEGWPGLLKNEAKDAYSQIRKMQVEYGGGDNGPVDMLLKNYSEGKDLLNALNIPAGKKITKTDLINPEYLVYDPSNLPNEFFKTKKSVQDLLSITKDSAFVQKQASDYVARMLKDKDAKAAEKYLFDNKEWIDLFPSLKSGIESHVESLRKAARVGPRTQELSKALKTDIKKLPIEAKESSQKAQTAAEKEAEKLLAESKKKASAEIKSGQTRAKEITGAVGKARSLLGSGDPVKEIEKLIVGGQTKNLADVAPYIKSDPKLMEDFSKAIDITISRSNPATIADDFERIIKPALENTGLIDAKKSAELSKRIRTVQMTLDPSAAAQTIRWIIRTGLTGEFGQIAAPAGAEVIEKTGTAVKDMMSGK